MDEIERRAFMKGAAIGALAFTVGGAEVMLTPRQARAQGVALRTLTADQAATLDAMGETLVPGAKDAGITHFVDQQISIPPQEALLEARIMNVKPPFANFYRAAFGAIDGASTARYGGRNFAQLAGNEQHEFVDLMRQNKLDGWKGPAAGFVYFLLRSDAVDVVYGTMDGGDAWKKGFAALGMRLTPAAVGINSTTFKGRPACIYDGWCHVGCPIGALSNPLVTYLAEARQAGAEVRPYATVTRVLTNADGAKATAVEYYAANKQRQVQEASVVVLAAWSAQNPRIMLSSATDKHPNGLANSSGLVGKYLTAHFASGTSALFDEDLQPYMGTIAAQYFSYDLYDKNAHKDKGAFGSTFMVAGAAARYSALGGVANARLDLFGAELAAFMKRAARGYTRLNAFAEEMPVIENRIELASDKDEFGMPLGKITHGFNDEAVALFNANFDKGVEIAKATGAKEAWPNKGPMPTIHLMGGTIMGKTPGDSVTDSFGQTHEIGNLWIAGPGIFPTSGAPNPTYTILALSLRGAEQLAKNWSSVAG